MQVLQPASQPEHKPYELTQRSVLIILSATRLAVGRYKGSIVAAAAVGGSPPPFPPGRRKWRRGAETAASGEVKPAVVGFSLHPTIVQ